MGAQQSISNKPKQTSCPNDVTCQNFDFAANSFACPNARCQGGMCNCGSDCVPFGGTCCRSVVYDQASRQWKCEELSGMQTKSPGCNVEVFDKTLGKWVCKSTGEVVTNVTHEPITYNPSPPPVLTPTPTPTPSSCPVGDKVYNGVVIPGHKICEWYNMN